LIRKGFVDIAKIIGSFDADKAIEFRKKNEHAKANHHKGHAEGHSCCGGQVLT